MRILHIINTLSPGGAQSVLHTLLRRWDRPEDQHLVISLRANNADATWHGLPNTQLAAIGLESGAFSPFKWQALLRSIRVFQPNLIQTWLYHSDLIGSLAARTVSRAPVFWGLHHTDFGNGGLPVFTRIELNILAFLSRSLPARIICCTDSAMEIHRDLGYSSIKLQVIRNGVDAERFSPNPTAHLKLTAELGLEQDVRLIGCFARYHPQKNHLLLLQAMQLLLKIYRNTHLVLAGSGVDDANHELVSEIHSRELDNHVHLLGVRNDIPDLAPALTLATLASSYGEALSIFLLEAMACGVPCVATDVGDVRRLVEGIGVVVPPNDPEALANGWRQLLTLSKAESQSRSTTARERVVKDYNSSSMISAYKDAYKKETNSE